MGEIKGTYPGSADGNFRVIGSEGGEDKFLIVGCRVPFEPAPKELKSWLREIVVEATWNGYAGFAFTKE